MASNSPSKCRTADSPTRPTAGVVAVTGAFVLHYRSTSSDTDRRVPACESSTPITRWSKHRLCEQTTVVGCDRHCHTLCRLSPAHRIGRHTSGIVHRRRGPQQEPTASGENGGAWLLEVTPDGEVEYERTLGGTADAVFYSVIEEAGEIDELVADCDVDVLQDHLCSVKNAK